jgi:hypothetical protein
MDCCRYTHQNYTELSIHWVSGVYEIHVDVKIDDYVNDAEFMQYFMLGHRDVDREWNGSRTRWNYDARHNFPYYTFNSGEVVKFHGGYDYQCSDSHANCLAETLKYRYEFAPTE